MRRGLAAVLAALLLVSRAAAAQDSALAVRSDPRLDLVALVQLLSGDSHNMEGSPELAQARAAFKKLRRHDAVKRLEALRKRGFAWNVPLQWAVYLSTPPELAPVYPVPGFFAQMAGGPEELEGFRVALSSFARESRFMDWEERQEPLRAKLAAMVEKARGGADIERPLEDYLGGRFWRGWRLAPGVFFPWGGSSSWIIEETGGLPEVEVAVGPRWEKGEPRLGDAVDLARAAWPEPIFAATYFMFEACKPRFKPKADLCASTPGFTEPENCVQRIWVDAITARLLLNTYGPAARERFLKSVPGQRTAEAEKALEAYEAGREIYADLPSYAPRLLAPFQADGKAPYCKLVDPSRYGEDVYPRRLLYWLDARLAKGPDPVLEKAREELLAQRARIGKPLRAAP
jgi:hypothetical protein